MGLFRDTHSVLQKSTNLQNEHFGVKETCTELYWTVNVWISELANILPVDVEGENYTKEQKTQASRQFIGWKRGGKLGWSWLPKIWDLVDHKADEKIRICSNYPSRHKTTLQGADCKAKLLGNWTKQHMKLKFCIVKYIVSMKVIKSFKMNQSFFPRFIIE